jgi:hypothetical protein
MANVSFGTFSKRRNSTKQPSVLSDQRSVTLKDLTSVDAPTFILTGNNFNYNYAKWDNRYYFITDIRSMHNNMTEVDCVIDPLATYKSDILASTQYVTYSSQLGDTWLADTRIPVLKSTTASKSSTNTGVLSKIGCYILSAVGKDRCYTYMINAEGTLGSILDSIARWDNQDVADLMNNINFGQNDVSDAMEGLATLMSRTSLMGNAYEAAPACIRSCIWVPFDNALAPAIDSGHIWLGMFETDTTATIISGKPVTGSTAVSIPWHFSDWRRGYSEDVYIYLPLVGLVSLSSDSLTNVSSISIDWSVTYTDGCIAYELKAGNEIIGSYGGQCSSNYPLGIAQQASAGSILNTAIQGASKAVAEAVDAGINVASVALAGTTGLATAAWDTANAALTSHPTCVGGIGGGAGVGLDTTIICYTVAHNTVVNPSDMKQTMGLPTMKPLQLSNLTGFCQCANAHVEAPAMANELDAIDVYLNTGFYIE